MKMKNMVARVSVQSRLTTSHRRTVFTMSLTGDGVCGSEVIVKTTS